MELIRKEGGHIDYADPYIPQFKKMRAHDFQISSIDLSAKVLSKYDAVILCTDHDDFDYDLIIDNSKLVIDARGRYSTGKYKNQKLKNLIKS